MERPRHSPVKREVMVRHLANLAIYTGFYKGKYFINGTYHPNEKSQTKEIPFSSQGSSKGRIYTGG